MDLFEGYVGIRLWNGQMVDDVIFSLLFVLLLLFAIVFRANVQLLLKMWKDAFLMKERKNLFDERIQKSGWFFHNFMIFQALFLCSIAFTVTGRIYGLLNPVNSAQIILYIGITGFVLFLYYQFKRLSYSVFGSVFAEADKYNFWRTSYNAIMGVWGISLYIPVLWLAFVGSRVTIPIVMFIILYILCRFVIIYKTIRIFYKKSTGLLYISLYLCGQEILPLVFLYEGIVYLYNFIETSTLWH